MKEGRWPGKRRIARGMIAVLLVVIALVLMGSYPGFAADEETADPTPTPAPETAPSTVEELTGRMNQDGIVLEYVGITSPDSKAILEIYTGTTALDGNGDPLGYIEVVQLGEPPLTPAGAAIVGAAYDCGPEGATFDPLLSVVIEYDPVAIPEGVAEEDLVIARFDADEQKWIELETLVDPPTHTVLAEVPSLATFAAYGAVAPPSTIKLWSYLGPFLGVVVPVGLLYYLNARGARRRMMRGEEDD